MPRPGTRSLRPVRASRSSIDLLTSERRRGCDAEHRGDFVSLSLRGSRRSAPHGPPEYHDVLCQRPSSASSRALHGAAPFNAASRLSASSLAHLDRPPAPRRAAAHRGPDRRRGRRRRAARRLARMAEATQRAVLHDLFAGAVRWPMQVPLVEVLATSSEGWWRRSPDEDRDSGGGVSWLTAFNVADGDRGPSPEHADARWPRPLAPAGRQAPVTSSRAEWLAPTTHRRSGRSWLGPT